MVVEGGSGAAGPPSLSMPRFRSLANSLASLSCISASGIGRKVNMRCNMTRAGCHYRTVRKLLTFRDVLRLVQGSVLLLSTGDDLICNVILGFRFCCSCSPCALQRLIQR